MAHNWRRHLAERDSIITQQSQAIGALREEVGRTQSHTGDEVRGDGIAFCVSNARVVEVQF